MKRLLIIIIILFVTISISNVDAKSKSKTKSNKGTSSKVKSSIVRGFGLGLGWQASKAVVNGAKTAAQSETAKNAWNKTKEATKKGYEDVKKKVKKE
jgi:hypothetical protein